MAPKRTWTAWVTDANGNRVERSGEGEMPADIHKQMLREAAGNDPAKTLDAEANDAAAATATAESPATPTPAPQIPAAPTVNSTEAVPAAATAASTDAAATPSVPLVAPPVVPPPATNHSLAKAAAVSAAPDVAAAGKPVATTIRNPAMIAVGVGIIVALTAFAVAAVLIYRRRLNRKDAAAAAAAANAAKATMFLDLGGSEKDISAPRPAVKARKIGDPQLINTTASEAIRGAAAVARPSRPPKSPTKEKTRGKPKLSLAMYRTSPAGIGAPTILPPSPSPRSGTRGSPAGFAVHDVSLASPMHATHVAPSPRRLTSFDCAPSPLPTDGRQRIARFDYSMHSDALPSPSLAPPRANVVGHRRTVSRGSAATRASTVNRQAVYGQHGLNRISTASSNGDSSLLSIPISTRYSFDRERWSGDTLDVHGMI